MINKILTTALMMAAGGIPVFPVRVTWNGKSWDKKPATYNGHHGRSTDPELIKSWFDNENDYQLAWVPADAGLVCIDPDVGANENDLQQLPPTRTIRTISGGHHLYYRTDQVFGNGGWAPKIDVRSGNGYTLIPPSRGYTVENHSQEVAMFPEWAAARLRAARAKEVREPIAADKLDLDVNMERARAYLRAKYAAVGEWGEHDDPMTYDIAAAVRDLGVSQEQCCDMMLGYLPEHEEPWLRMTVGNAYKYAQNAEGARAAGDPVALYPPEVVAEAEVEYDATLDRFQGREPDEDEALEDITFWDAEKMLPRMPCTVIIYGDSGAHKTNVALRMCFEAMVQQGAKIRFAAGEGAHGVRKLRVPAQAKALGLTTRELRGRWRTIPAVPLLSDPSQVSAFITAQKQLGPCDIVVIDTWSTAVAGEDDNASVTAAMLTDNGAVGMIKRELSCMVIILDHIGKMAARGVRGASAKRGNADVVLLCEADKEAGTVVLTCEKMRDGPDGHASYWKLSDGVPVPERCAPHEIRGERTEDHNLFGVVYARLETHGVVGADKGIDDRRLLDLVEPDQSAGERRAKILKRLRNGRRGTAGKEWATVLHQTVPLGEEKAVWLWYLQSGS